MINEEILIKDAVLYGMGYICGKHNLEISKEEREKIAKEYLESLKLTKEDKYKKAYDILICYFDSISDEEKVIVDKQLKELNL